MALRLERPVGDTSPDPRLDAGEKSAAYFGMSMIIKVDDFTEQLSEEVNRFDYFASRGYYRLRSRATPHYVNLSGLISEMMYTARV